MAIKKLELAVSQETATSFAKFKAADESLVELVRRVHNNVQKNRSSKELYSASKGLSKICRLIAKTMEASFKGMQTSVRMDTGSHDIEGYVMIDEDEDQPEGAPDIGVGISIDGNFKGSVSITIYMGRKSKSFKTTAVQMKSGLLLNALTELNSWVSKSHQKR